MLITPPSMKVVEMAIQNVRVPRVAICVTLMFPSRRMAVGDVEDVF